MKLSLNEMIHSPTAAYVQIYSSICIASVTQHFVCLMRLLINCSVIQRCFSCIIALLRLMRTHE